MSSRLSRRDFVGRALTAGTIAGLGDFAFLSRLRPVSADEAKPSKNMVRLTPEMEPLVRLIEDTPRDKLLEVVADRVKRGLSYQQLLAGVMLAGVRSIKPRPVGFKFHAVLVVNSAHLASLAAPDTDRWLPLFWALDNFKGSQARNEQESGGWVMAPVEESKLPPTHQARQQFMEAMDNWDEERADRAIVSYVRSAGAADVLETLWRYGARDFRDIGHKAIYTANSWRTLQCIGWRHAEPVMRSLAFAILEHSGDNPAKRDDPADRPWRENLKRASRIRADWQQGQVSPKATSDLLATLRSATPAEACEHVVDLLNQKIAPASIWDGLFLTAGELIMRQPGIVGIHCVTSINGLHYGFQACANDETRRLLMLQGPAFLAMFRTTMEGRGGLADLRIDTLEKTDLKAQGAEAIEEIFAEVSKDRLAAARKTLALLGARSVSEGPASPVTNAPGSEVLMTAGRRLIFTKGRDSHDYKFSSAALEDYYHATPAWRDRFLATSMFNLHGSQDPDNGLIKRTRAALQG
jgi:hypothetical protein